MTMTEATYEEIRLAVQQVGYAIAPDYLDAVGDAADNHELIDMCLDADRLLLVGERADLNAWYYALSGPERHELRQRLKQDLLFI